MESKDRRLNILSALLLTGAVMILAAVIGDYYFDLNDDVLMKDILSGSFTGTPAGHNIQMLYPISAFISLFYRVFRSPDWYGIFLCFCQYLCIFLIFARTGRTCKDALLKAEAFVFEFLLFTGVMGAHLVFVQYTFTCGMLSATAAFLIMTDDKKIRKDLILPALLIILAYLIRSEMLLLTLPMVGVAILIRWALSRKNITDKRLDGKSVCDYGDRKKLFKRYLIFCISLVLGLVISQAVHILAYSSPEWKEFNRLFDARTELYDFQYIPDYAENRDFYESINLSESEQNLLINYNFGLDDEINADILRAVAEHAAQLRTDEIPLPRQLLNAIPLYIYRLTHFSTPKSYQYPMTDHPWNAVTIIMYLGVLLVFAFGGKKGTKRLTLLLLAILFACRSSLWIYIIARGRDPIRITHPMYLVEILILLGILLQRSEESRKNIFIPVVIGALVSLVAIPGQMDVIRQELGQRELMRAHYDALYDYFDSHRDSFYFVDVYTSVSVADAIDRSEATFSEKMFDRVDNTAANHDLMGGWASKSPLTYEKYALFGIENMESALLTDNVYFVQLTSDDTDWITDYYSEKGIETKVTEIDEIEGVFKVYSLSGI